MAYVALSRARDEALIYTDSVPSLRETLSRAADKEMALEATRGNSRDKQQHCEDLTNDSLAAQEQHFIERSLNQSTTEIDATRVEATELAVETEDTELAAALLD
jgi:hypothetical protein